MQLQINKTTTICTTRASQCSIDYNDQFSQTIDDNQIQTRDEQSNIQIEQLNDEIRNLHFQLSSRTMQQTAIEHVRIRTQSFIKFVFNDNYRFVEN
jgi:hypothetical protein